ncbi:phosphodiester glycosidase family protein [Leadbettera azotonutricia]|uniref:Putative lipoprotein n=1 Tax=Leadbettera azotonutricia (strain ATCC BAA-888 / DSM 13862 / ZAS-9) TaxID=545695 RepID=F5Y6Q5_LEAAZ|nr:phosphodiester glycosidase family protein [Leadbettera azotonutricia]AEF82127.1 putative lipoprotein [Leadbettera azotonutricia ZAS-9]
MRRILILFFILPLFFACTTISPVSGAKEKTQARQDAIKDLTPLWRPLAFNLPAGHAPALGYFEARLDNPKIELWAIRADLSDPRLKIIVSDANISTHVSAFAETTNSLAAINATPFDPVSGRQGEERANIGIVISGGKLIARPHPSYDALVFYKNNKAAIIPQSEIIDKIINIEEIENAVGGFGIVLKDSRPVDRVLAQDNPPRHPRSAVAVSNQYLYLLAVDGRRPGSRGITEAELALILQKFGARDGLNLDGGGSTALALRFLDGNTKNVNVPIHNHIPGLERGVAACLGLGVK